MTPLRRAAITALAVVALLSAASAALACSCVRYASAAEQLKEVSVAFVGQAQRTRTVASGQAVTRFGVRSTIKGAPARHLAIVHSRDTAMCGVRFLPGRTYTILADRDETGALSTSGCRAAQFPLEDYRRAARAG